MASVTVELRNVTGTQAALGWAGAHTIVVDRAEGRAGGMGLGFNGAELLALALGGCFCNDLRYVSESRGVALHNIAVSVTLHLEGEPLLTTAAAITVACQAIDGSDPQSIIDEAKAGSMVANTLQRGMSVTIQTIG